MDADRSLKIALRASDALFDFPQEEEEKEQQEEGGDVSADRGGGGGGLQRLRSQHADEALMARRAACVDFMQWKVALISNKMVSREIIACEVLDIALQILDNLVLGRRKSPGCVDLDVVGARFRVNDASAVWVCAENYDEALVYTSERDREDGNAIVYIAFEHVMPANEREGSDGDIWATWKENQHVGWKIGRISQLQVRVNVLHQATVFYFVHLLSASCPCLSAAVASAEVVSRLIREVQRFRRERDYILFAPATLALAVMLRALGTEACADSRLLPEAFLRCRFQDDDALTLQLLDVEACLLTLGALLARDGDGVAQTSAAPRDNSVVVGRAGLPRRRMMTLSCASCVIK